MHEIYQPELWVACRILSEVGDLLKGAFAAAQEAVMAEEAPQTTSPRYFELREEALRAELDKAKERLRADLDEAH